MNDDVAKIINRLSGKPCSRKEVGYMRSLSLGFGNETECSTKLSKKVYREWEIGTYSSAWRVVQRGIVLCGSRDVADDLSELNIALGHIDFGNFASLRQLSELDIRVEFSNGVAVDFFAAISDDDECFHIFCPDNVFIEFSTRRGWKTGRSDKPCDC